MLEKDLTILMENKLMDYSLLFIIIEVPKPSDTDYSKIWDCFGEVRYHSRLVKSKNQKFIYCMGIIDYLQVFNYKKYLENKYKNVLYGNKINKISAVDPVLYADRMLNFASDYILTPTK